MMGASSVVNKLSDKLWTLLGSQAQRNQKKSLSVIERSSSFAPDIEKLDDAELVQELRDSDFLNQNPTEQARWCALISEASSRALSLTPYSTQLQGTLRLLVGDIIQMATGEGKTLVGALAACGYVLSGHRVHIMGINDYLAQRDHQLMQPLFSFLGITSGFLTETTSRSERKAIYQSDVVYGSVHEFGFDVLKENQILSIDEAVLGERDVVIVDEADSVLVDDALTPLVLAGSLNDGGQQDSRINAIVARLVPDKDFTINSLQGSVTLSEEGAEKIEEELGGISLYSPEHISTTLISVNLSLQAHYLTHRDIHYVVRNGAVKLINTSRGRISELQRWPDGLQEAVEIKEGLARTDTGTVIDSITVQALTKEYNTICGMTGTALAAGEQFRQFYDLAISVIEPYKKNIREDLTTRVFDTKAHKAQALIEHIVDIHDTGRPILIGTHDVAESEELAELLTEQELEVKVLNAKNDSQEADIIADSGKKNAITVSTQMAGRGTDIKLGGHNATADENKEVVELGGLYVVGTGLHETARLDDQLRGRAGRQGDPGTSIFFASLEDPLITRYAPVTKLSPKHIDDKGLVTKSKGLDYFNQAQKISEGMRLEIHANTWKYNEIINKQRKVFTQKRREFLGTNLAWKKFLAQEPKTAQKLLELHIPVDVIERTCSEIVLYNLDLHWSEHLEFASQILSSIHLRALGNESPIESYTNIMMEAFSELSEQSWKSSREMFTHADINEEGIKLPDLERKRSLHTWTYMMHDNPFTNSGAKLLSGIIGIFK